MGHRRRRQVDWAIQRTIAAADHEMGDEGLNAAVGVHHPLGQTGGAACGRDRDHIVKIDRNSQVAIRVVSDPGRQRDGALRFTIYAYVEFDFWQLRPQCGDRCLKVLLKEQHIAVEGVEDVAILVGGIARTYRNPGHIGPPQPERAGPGGGVIAGPDRALAAAPETGCQQRARDAAAQPPDLIEAIGAVFLDVGRTLGVDAPAAVEEIDDRHGRTSERGDAGTRQSALLQEAQQIAVTEGFASRRESDSRGLAV